MRCFLIKENEEIKDLLLEKSLEQSKTVKK